MKNSFVVPLAIIAAGGILAFAVYTSFDNTNTTSPLRSNNANTIPSVSTHDHILGNPSAKLIIVEYADFDCTHCKIFNVAVRQIVNDYGAQGDVAWAFRNFALTELYPNARKHAEAAECVAKVAGNEAYFAFHNLLYANQPADPTKYAEYAKKAGASPEAVADCIQQAATNGIDARIDAERAQALAAGAQGAPFSLFMVVGKPPFVIDGAASYPDLKSQIDLALRTLTL